VADDNLNLREDPAGQSPPNVSGNLEATAFDQAAAAHSLAQSKLEFGMFGLFGNTQSAPNHIAFVALTMSVCLAAACLIASAFTVEAEAKFLQSFAERSFALSGTCLGFIFGRSSTKT
jgi:hypothetical protein